jgi:hypothetical protein
MNTLAGNAAAGAPTATLQQHTCSTSPIGEQQLKVTVYPAPEAVFPPPILITDQQVAVSTAVTMPLRPRTVHWRSEAAGVAVAVVHRMLVRSTSDGRQLHEYCSRRYEFLERSCMARAMDRL